MDHYHRTKRNLLLIFLDQSGAVTVIVAILLTIFLGIAALAIDVGHVMVVRSELQNAADAAALFGANNFYPKTSSGFNSISPNWSAAEAAVTTNAPTNKSDGVILVNYEVESGYWNIANVPYGLQSKGITPGANDFPAIKVTVRKTAGYNGGPVKNFFAGILGKPTSEVSATATAICSSPGIVLPGAILPIAIPKWMADKANQHNGPSEDKIITIGSAYHYEDAPGEDTDAVAGQWTSLDVDDNSANYLKDLIVDGNKNSLAIGDNIYIQPGTMATGFHDKTMGLYVGKDVVFPVVDAVLRDSIKQEVPIYAFAGFHITELIKNKGIKGYFIKDVYVGQSGPYGPYYGTYSPPRLVE